VQAAFEVAEQHGDGLDPLLVGQVLQALFANLVGRGAAGAIGLGCQVELFQLLVRESEKIAIFSGHGSPLLFTRKNWSAYPRTCVTWSARTPPCCSKPPRGVGAVRRQLPVAVVRIGRVLRRVRVPLNQQRIVRQRLQLPRQQVQQLLPAPLNCGLPLW
jgi:hypothetical protein